MGGSAAGVENPVHLEQAILLGFLGLRPALDALQTQPSFTLCQRAKMYCLLDPLVMFPASALR